MVREKTCWVIANESSGFLSQALGLAEALGIKFEKKRFIRKFLHSLLPFRFFASKSPDDFLTRDSDKLEPPWPDILIASGSRSIDVVRYIREKSQRKTYTIYIQDPRIDPSNFDLIFSMYHDKIEGANVHKTNMSLHRITDKKLEEEYNKFIPLFSEMKKPINCILIGGSAKGYRMSRHECRGLLAQIIQIKNTNIGTLLITTSRRTPEYMTSLLKEHIKDNKTYIFDQSQKENPYFAMLAAAKKIFVTNDSVSMISEACATGKEVYTISLSGMKREKLKLFSDNLIMQHWISKFEGRKTTPPHPVKYNETQKAAEIVREKLILERGFKESDFKN